MKIRIKETGKLETLTIIDPNSGVNWAGDLVGNDEDITYNDDTDEYECQQSAYDWWANHMYKHQAADERWTELLRSADADDDTHDKMQDDYYSSHGHGDLEDWPDALNEICDKWAEILAKNS